MKNCVIPKAKNSLRPMEFPFFQLWRTTAYLPEHGRNSTGTTRKVFGKIWECPENIIKYVHIC